MSQWLDLHTQLANTLGDPRDSSGALIISTTNGIRYTANQRAYVLSQAIRWTVCNLMDDKPYTSLLVSETPTVAGSTLITLTTLSSSVIMKLLAVETTDTPIMMVPIISRKHKKLLRTKNSHWNSTPFAYVSGPSTIGVINPGAHVSAGDYTITYLKDFTNMTGSTVDFTMDYIPQNLFQYVISYAVHLVKLNEQRWKEALELKNDSITEAITFKNLEEGNGINKTK